MHEGGLFCKYNAEPGVEKFEVYETDEFTGLQTVLAYGETEEEARANYAASLPKVSCDLENPHLCESCQ